MVIGFAGQKNSGKNTAASMLNFIFSTDGLVDYSVYERFNSIDFLTNTYFEEKQFAGPVKKIASTITGIEIKDFEDETIKASVPNK